MGDNRGWAIWPSSKISSTKIFLFSVPFSNLVDTKDHPKRSRFTGEIRALWEEQQLQGFSDVTEVVQHIPQVLLVFLPATMDEDKAGHLHGPAWKASAVLSEAIWEKKSARQRVGPTEAGHSLERGLEAYLLQAQVAVAQQAAPKEHPVQTRAVVHDDDATLAGDEGIARDHHFYAEHQLQERLFGKGGMGVGG